jgi:hypothetical protein
MSASEIAAGPVKRVLRAWEHFWFTPADPTLLGLIRICCGVVTLYTILAYSFTLQDLFGPDAWVNLQMRLKDVHAAPVRAVPVDWDESRLYLSPETPEQKAYAEDYARKWGGPPPAPYPRTAEEADAIDEYRKYWGVDPRLTITKGQPVWSIWFHVTDPFWMAVVHSGIVLIVLMFTIGLCTRITSALTWAGALSYIHRSPATLFGVDTMMTILLLYLMIGPSGAALSVDRKVARWWARKHRSGKAAPASAAAPVPSVSANLAIRLLQVHVCIIYLAAGLSKLLGNAWWNTTAVWGTLANFEFAPMQYETYMAPLRFLAGHRALWEVFMTAAGLFTLTFEIGYAFLIWRPSTRWVILGMAVTLHGFIGLFMGLKTFSLMMLVMNMAFLDPDSVRRFLARWTSGQPPTPADRPAVSAPAEAVAVGAASTAFRAEKEPQPATAVRRVKRNQ